MGRCTLRPGVGCTARGLAKDSLMSDQTTALRVPTSPAVAYWNQRQRLSECRERLELLAHCVDRLSDLSVFQWAQLMAMALDFVPDLILELGRLRGNSTCAFTEAAGLLTPHRCQVLSICNSPEWDETTRPRLEKLLP